MPITITSALCAEDIVRVFLGSKCALAAPTVRFLAPTILTIGLLYPLGTLLFSIEKGMRSLKIALLTAPVVILAEMVGLRYGPLGIAAGLSVATALLVLPVIFWAAHKTPVSAGEMLREILRPLLSSLIAAGTLLACTSFLQPLSSPLLRLIVANTCYSVSILSSCFLRWGRWRFIYRCFVTPVSGLSSAGGGESIRSLPKCVIRS